MTLEKAFTEAERDQNDLYFQVCLERTCSFTPIVYYADVIPVLEALESQKRLAALSASS